MTEVKEVVEHVLVVPRDRMETVFGNFQGFKASDPRAVVELFRVGGPAFLPRADMETNPRYKQIIPYCVFYLVKKPNYVYAYRRTPKGGESRLHGKRSLGVGGHIDPADGCSFPGYITAMWREIHEELEVAPRTLGPSHVVGLLNDDSVPPGTPEGKIPVGQVHLGVVHLIPCFGNISRRCEDLADDGFYPLAELQQDCDSFETWSQLLLHRLADVLPSQV